MAQLSTLGGLRANAKMHTWILGSDSESWYGWMFVGLAIFIVCPVWCLNEIGGRFGWVITWRHVIWLEAVFISIMLVSTILLMRVYPKLGWDEPLSGIAFVALIRGGIWVMRQVFKSEFDDE